MAKGVHKGTELSNISETWDQNERKKESDNTPGTENTTSGSATENSDLQQVIKEEAAEYDNANKEERILGGERATVNDDRGNQGADE